MKRYYIETNVRVVYDSYIVYADSEEEAYRLLRESNAEVHAKDAEAIGPDYITEI